MPSNLPIAVTAGGSFFEIDAAKDGVVAVFLADREHAFLQAAFFFPLLFFGGLFGFPGGVVREEIELLVFCDGAFPLFGFRFRNHVGGRHIDPADEKEGGLH